MRAVASQARPAARYNGGYEVKCAGPALCAVLCAALGAALNLAGCNEGAARAVGDGCRYVLERAPASERISTPESITPHDQVAWVNIIMLALLAAFGPFCTDLYLPAVPTITRQLHTDAATLQLTLTTSFLGLALGQLFIGPIAGGIVLSRAIACDLFQGARLTQFMSLLMTINSLAPILGPIFGSFITTYFNWSALFWFLALWGALLYLAAFKAIPETLPSAQRSPRIRAALWDLLRECHNPPFICMALALSIISGAFFGYLAASPFIFQVIFGLSALQYSIVFAVSALFITLGANVAAWLAQRVPERKIAMVALWVQLLAPLGLALEIWLSWHSFFLVAGSFALFLALNGMVQSTGFTEVMAVRRGGAGAATGLFGVLNFFFGALTAPLVGLMGESSLFSIMLVMLGGSILALILFPLGLKLRSRAQSGAQPERA